MSNQSETFDTLMFTQDAIHLAYLFLNTCDYLWIADQIFVILKGNMMNGSPVMEEGEVGRYQGAGEFLVFTDYHYLFNEHAFFKAIFNNLRCDIFSTGEFENLFFPVSNFEKLIVDNRSYVTRVKPSLTVDGLGCKCRL